MSTVGAESTESLWSENEWMNEINSSNTSTSVFQKPFLLKLQLGHLIKNVLLLNYLITT